MFKGKRFVVPAAMRKEMMVLAHASHVGIEGSIRRARETMFWPRMSSELKKYIAKCDICMAHRSSPAKEPIVQHEFAAPPVKWKGGKCCQDCETFVYEVQRVRAIRVSRPHGLEKYTNRRS